MTLVKRVRCPGDNRHVQCLVALYRLAYCIQATPVSTPGRELASYVHTLTDLSNAATAVPYSWSTYPGRRGQRLQGRSGAVLRERPPTVHQLHVVPQSVRRQALAGD